VERFEEAFESWMDTQSETDRMFMPGIVERAFTKKEADLDEVRRRELAVAEAAGLAAKAVQATGSFLVVQGLPGPVDPISNWRNMTMSKAFLTPGELRATCASIKGRLAKGLNLTIRNVATHTRRELTEQEGMEQLGAYSHLARLLDQCSAKRHVDDPAKDL
jgi:Protein of unknown function (Hypoth_ymh)